MPIHMMQLRNFPVMQQAKAIFAKLKNEDDLQSKSPKNLKAYSYLEKNSSSPVALPPKGKSTKIVLREMISKFSKPVGQMKSRISRKLHEKLKSTSRPFSLPGKSQSKISVEENSENNMTHKWVEIQNLVNADSGLERISSENSVDAIEKETKKLIEYLDELINDPRNPEPNGSQAVRAETADESGAAEHDSLDELLAELDNPPRRHPSVSGNSKPS